MRIFITSIEALFYYIPITYLKLRLNHSSSKVMARTNVCVVSLDGIMAVTANLKIRCKDRRI